jgi:hypothetical protein
MNVSLTARLSPSKAVVWGLLLAAPNHADTPVISQLLVSESARAVSDPTRTLRV